LSYIDFLFEKLDQKEGFFGSVGSQACPVLVSVDFYEIIFGIYGDFFARFVVHSTMNKYSSLAKNVLVLATTA
jgi:hypothetical protein